jgi:acetyl-CoA acyltransferase 1
MTVCRCDTSFSDEDSYGLEIVQAMGWTSEMVAETYKVSREKQDEYALISHTRANEVCNHY